MSDLITARLADSTRPGRIPDLFRLRPNGVAPYIDGSLYRWSTVEIESFPRVWRICVTGDPAMAPHARVLDVERFDAGPDQVEPYRLVRAQQGEAMTTYCNRETVPAVVNACAHWRELDWWLATLDNQPWTPSTIVAWIKNAYGIELDPEKIRAIQNHPMGDYDMSACFGDPRFASTHHTAPALALTGAR